LDQCSAEYFTTGAVAQDCGVSGMTVLRWIQRGHLPAFRLPEGHYRIHRDDLGEFLMNYEIPIRGRMVKTAIHTVGSTEGVNRWQ